MIPDHITPEDRASIRYVAGTCDGPFDRAIGNLIRSLVNDIEQWQNAAADIWDEGHRTRVQRGPDDCTCNARNKGECACGEYGNGPIITTNPYRIEHT